MMLISYFTVSPSPNSVPDLGPKQGAVKRIVTSVGILPRKGEKLLAPSVRAASQSLFLRPLLAVSSLTQRCRLSQHRSPRRRACSSSSAGWV